MGMRVPALRLITMVTSPFACAECEEDAFAWLTMGPAMCTFVTRVPTLATIALILLVLGAAAQLLTGLKQTWAHKRLAKAPLLRAVLLLLLPLAFRVCSTSGGIDGCLPSASPVFRNHSFFGF